MRNSRRHFFISKNSVNVFKNIQHLGTKPTTFYARILRRNLRESLWPNRRFRPLRWGAKSHLRQGNSLSDALADESFSSNSVYSCSQRLHERSSIRSRSVEKRVRAQSLRKVKNQILCNSQIWCVCDDDFVNFRRRLISSLKEEDRHHNISCDNWSVRCVRYRSSCNGSIWDFQERYFSIFIQVIQENDNLCYFLIIVLLFYLKFGISYDTWITQQKMHIHLIIFIEDIDLEIDLFMKLKKWGYR